MYPTNHYMDPYHSHYRSHSPYPYYPPQGWEIPSGHPRKMDSSCRPPTYGPWPYNAVMHHPHPSEFHCCCNHTYPPDYYSFRPPLPQELPPPHLYYHGPFPQHSNASLYFVPPHQYPVDQMPHGYDKLKSHCCGCPNHVCDGAEKSNVKIKEENPDVKLESEQKDSDGGTIIRHPKNQYPFIWLPSGNMEGKENGKRFELSPHQLLNGWAPVKSTGDAKRQEQDNQEEQFHWPIVWMPARYDEPKQKDKEMKEMEEVPKAPNNSEEAPRSPKIKIIPLSWFENDHRDQKPAARDGSGDHSDRAGVKSQPAVAEHQGGMTLEASPKTSPAVPKIEKDERKPAKENKTIPVEPKREIDEKKASTYRTIPVIKESDEKKTSISEKKEAKKASNAEKLEENGKTKHSESSTAKHAKLPPVCLRLDPLPKRKSGNGSSRSPSPPTSKDGDKAKKDVKEAQSQNLEPKQSDTKHITMHEVKEKSPDGMKGVGVSNKTVQAASAEHSQKEEVPISKHDQKVQTDCTNIGSQENAGGKTSQGGAMQENTNGESLKGCDKSTKEDETVIGSEAAKDATRTCRTNLSEQDAAVRIQCAYRGYDVRRWQPLDKLRKIRDVHEQMQGVKKQLQCLEDSCKKLTEKEQVSIGETIMNLLLKLDTIQGLHQSVREARKSVARELVCLQEKLDTLCKKSSGEFNHTKSDEEKLESSEKNLTPDSSENIGQIAAPTVTTEASDKSQQGAVEPGMVEEPSSVDSVEPCDAVPAVVPMEMDAGASEQQNQKEEEPCTTTMEEAHEKGKAAGQVEFQVASSIDMMSDAALPEHPTENKEHVIEGSNAVSVEQLTEEKPAVEGEWKEVPLVNSTESFPDAASSGDSSELKQCTASTEQNLHAQSNTGLPSASTEDVNATAAAASVESGVATEKDVPLDSQMQGSAAVESLELKHDVSPAEENQQTELSGQVVHLEDPSLPLQVEEQHDLIPAEAGDNSMLERAVDTMQDSTKEPDGTPEASMNNMTLSACAYTEKPDLEPTLESDSAPEQTVLDETDDPVQCRVYGKDEPPRVDQKAEPAVDKLTGASVNGGDSHLEESMKKPDIQESYPNLAEEADDSCELSCGHEGGITGHERSEAEVCSESQTDSQKEHADLGVSETYECTETRKEAPEDVSGANSAEDAGVQGSLMEKCTEMPKDAQVGVPGANSTEDVDVQVSVTERRAEDAPVSVAGANPAEEEADKLKRTVAMNSENKASEETLSAAVTPDDGMKDNNEKKLAEENQQLKELLQKLLASGNDQMGVITDLSEKVKALERKLARKKRPKVRVHKPSRHATAKVH